MTLEPGRDGDGGRDLDGLVVGVGNFPAQKIRAEVSRVANMTWAALEGDA